MQTVSDIITVLIIIYNYTCVAMYTYIISKHDRFHTFQAIKLFLVFLEKCKHNWPTAPVDNPELSDLTVSSALYHLQQNTIIVATAKM